jgi:oligogalacturonide lyase
MSVTRRQFALTLAAAPALRAQFTPIRRYLDPSTEVEVLALSDPSYPSYLTHHSNRAVSSRGGFLVYATGTNQDLRILRLDIKGGATRVLTSSAALEPKSLALSPDDRTLYFADGDRLLAIPTSGGKPRELFKASSPESFRRGLSLSEDGAAIALIDNNRLEWIPTSSSARTSRRTLTDLDSSASHPSLSRSGFVFFRDARHGLHLVSTTNSTPPQRLPLDGHIGPALWNPDGRSILYLRLNQGPGIPNSLFEYSLDSTKESLVGKTSQFVTFNRNFDSSVFVGASGSKAQPYILLMLRITRRELALCEHKSSDPASVSPVFSPNAQRIFFQSDRLGKPAIFSVSVDKLVEKNESEDPADRKS